MISPNLMFIGIGFILLAVIAIHHSITHKGQFIDFFDVTKAFQGITSSHEGWLIIILLVMIGVII